MAGLNELVCQLCEKPDLMPFRRIIDIDDDVINKATRGTISMETVKKVCNKCFQNLLLVGKLLFQWQCKVSISIYLKSPDGTDLPPHHNHHDLADDIDTPNGTLIQSNHLEDTSNRKLCETISSSDPPSDGGSLSNGFTASSNDAAAEGGGGEEEEEEGDYVRITEGDKRTLQEWRIETNGTSALESDSGLESNAASSLESTTNTSSSVRKSAKMVLCSICGLRCECRAELKKHAEVAHPQFLSCDTCHAQFPSRKKLLDHVKWHNPDYLAKIWKPCPECGKSVNKLNDHLRRAHGIGDTKRFLCRSCPMAFWDKCRLKEHERIHTNEKPYKCPDCDKTFRLLMYLTRHRTIHTGEKKYKCRYCGKGFRGHGNMVVHEQTVHEKLFFACPYNCGKEFRRKRHAVDHGLDCPERPLS